MMNTPIDRSSAPQRAWAVRSADPRERDEAMKIAHEVGTHPLIVHLLRQRDFKESAAISSFLEASLKDLPDPELILDCDLAARRILDAIANQEKIVVYGDYDVDGVTSSALLLRYFWRAFGVEVEVYIPHRLTEGYGLNCEAVRTLASRGAQLLITVDNGSAAIEEVKLAQELGVDVIIVDHHVVSDPEPPAFAHLNPQRLTCSYPDQRLAAVGVAFMLLIHLRRLTRDDPRFVGAPQPNLSHLLDIVALGTVADVALLQGVNRSLVRFGISRIRSAPLAGVRAMSELAKVDLTQLNAQDIAYKLGPRLNAAGRIDDARCGLQLLMSDDPRFTHQLATHVEQFNRERRSIQEQILQEAILQAEQYAQDPVIIVSSPHWHHGVVGIVASRLVETFYRPAIVLGGDEQEDGRSLFKGSARSLADLNIKRALDQCADHLIGYGGHAAAAGMTLYTEQLDPFRKTLKAVLSQAQDELFDRPPLIADAELTLSDVNAELLERLATLEPFGHGNPSPIFITRGVRAQATTLSSGKHLKLTFNLPPDHPAEAVGWRMGNRVSLCQDLVDLCYQPSWNTFRGVRKIVLTLKDIRPHSSELEVI